MEWLVRGARRHAKQLLYGKRRIGKSSCLLRAAETLKSEHRGEVFYVDLSRYASLVDAANALLLTASPVVHRWGGKWLHQLATLMQSVSLKLGVLSLDVDVRSKDKTEQEKGFTDILDSLNVVAEKRRIPVVVAIDEFQDIVRLGAERAEWSLRSVLQAHASLGYFLAGSEERLIEQMTGKDGAFMNYWRPCSWVRFRRTNSLHGSIRDFGSHDSKEKESVRRAFRLPEIALGTPSILHVELSTLRSKQGRLMPQPYSRLSMRWLRTKKIRSSESGAGSLLLNNLFCRRSAKDMVHLWGLLTLAVDTDSSRLANRVWRQWRWWKKATCIVWDEAASNSILHSSNSGLSRRLFPPPKSQSNHRPVARAAVALIRDASPFLQSVAKADLEAWKPMRCRGSSQPSLSW